MRLEDEEQYIMVFAAWNWFSRRNHLLGVGVRGELKAEELSVKAAPFVFFCLLIGKKEMRDRFDRGSLQYHFYAD